MNERVLTGMTTATAVVLGVVGFVDAVRDDRTGPAVLFAVLAVLVLALGRAASQTRSVTLRRDLMRWLEQVSPATGEDPDAMTNRAVSRLRAGFAPHLIDDTP